VSQRINLANGVDIPFLRVPAAETQDADKPSNPRDIKSTIDPHSFLSIFEGEGLYQKDGIHATLKGDHLIAEKVLDLILPDLSARQPSGREVPEPATER
jgi:hypothetical protein